MRQDFCRYRFRETESEFQGTSEIIRQPRTREIWVDMAETIGDLARRRPAHGNGKVVKTKDRKAKRVNSRAMDDDEAPPENVQIVMRLSPSDTIGRWTASTSGRCERIASRAVSARRDNRQPGAGPRRVRPGAAVHPDRRQPHDG